MALECQGFTCGAVCCLCPRNTLHAQLSYLPRFEHVAQCSSHRLQGKSRATDACIDCSTKPTGSSGAIKDRKSTRLNSSHSQISYAVFCLKKKKTKKKK